MANIIPLTSASVTSTGSVDLTTSESVFGGFDLSCNGTNLGTLVIRDSDASGRILVNTSSVSGKVAYGPMPCSGTIYYSVSGTGASAFLYEWYR